MLYQNHTSFTNYNFSVCWYHKAIIKQNPRFSSIFLEKKLGMETNFIFYFSYSNCHFAKKQASSLVTDFTSTNLLKKLYQNTCYTHTSVYKCGTIFQRNNSQTLWFTNGKLPIDYYYKSGLDKTQNISVNLSRVLFF